MAYIRHNGSIKASGYKRKGSSAENIHKRKSRSDDKKSYRLYGMDDIF